MAKTKRQLQAEATKALLYEKAKEMIRDRGYDAITVSDITDACGVTKGTFYHYFKSKDEMLSYVERAPYVDLNEELQEMEGTLDQKLRHYIRRRLEMMQKNDVDFTRQWLRHAADSSYHDLYGDDTKIAFDTRSVERCLKEAVENGTLRQDAPLEALSQMINFTLYGTTLCYCMNDGNFDIQGWIQTFSDFLSDHILRQFARTE